MRVLDLWVVFLGFLLFGGAVGCKGKRSAQVNAVQVSPVRQPKGEVARRLPARAEREIDDDDEEEDDEEIDLVYGPAEDAEDEANASPGTVRSNGAAMDDEEDEVDELDELEEDDEEENPADAKEDEAAVAQAKKETQQAIDQTLEKARGGLSECFRGLKQRKVTVDLALRVHRSGRVLSSSLKGVDQAQQKCLTKVLAGLRVDGVKTDTINVTRKLEFSRD